MHSTVKNIMGNIEIICALIGALISIVGFCTGIRKHYDKKKAEEAATKQRNEKQDQDIAKLKDENYLIVYSLFACLDGLEQMGCNHSVPVAKNKLNDYINKQAHDQ